METLTEVKNETLEKDGAEIALLAKNYAIKSEADYVAADEVLKRIKKYMNDLCAFSDPRIEAAHAPWKRETTFKKTLLDPAKAAYEFIGRLMGKWQDDERKRVAAENARIEAERQKEIAAEKKRLEDEQLKKAAELEEFGFTEKAEEEIQKPIEPIIATPVPKPVIEQILHTKNTAFTKTYKMKVNDLKALVKAAMENEAYLIYLEPNEKTLNALARSSKGTAKIPGCEVIEDSKVGARL